MIPFWRRGQIHGLVRRPLAGDHKYLLPTAEELLDGHRPLFIPTQLKREICLVEGYIDALAVAATGRTAVAVRGTTMSGEQEADLKRLLSEDTTLYILPDADEEGAKPARTWAKSFFPNAKSCPASYGEGVKDIADTF